MVHEENRVAGPLAEDLFAAWALRVEEGEALQFDELLAAHPDHAAELRSLHEDWNLYGPVLGIAVPGLITSESGIVLPSIGSDPDVPEGTASEDLLERLGIRAPRGGRYRFRSVLGRGGGGVVIKVWDAKLNRPLAMKLVLGQGEERPTGDTPKLDSRTLSRFVDEARIGSQLNHPAIVPVYELGEDESGRAFFTMRLVKGQNLAQVFERVHAGDPEWSQTRALTVLLRVCEAMSYAHDRGVIHRDLKPANVMVGSYGEVHTMDWGLARVLGQPDHRDLRPRPQPAAPASVVHSFRTGERDERPDSSLVTMDGSVLGTPCYMAPEQARGDLEAVGPRTDVYAVGAMLYHLLSGAAPYLPGGEPLPAGVVLTNLLHGPPRPIESAAPRAVPELVAICDRAMARTADARYASMKDLAGDLQDYLEGRVVRAYETGTWAETRKWVRRNRALSISLAVLIALATGGSAALAYLRNDAVVQRDLANWRALVATALVKFPDDHAMRAMLLRDGPSVRPDPETAARAVSAVQGEYHRVCCLTGHAGAVLTAQFSPDDSRVVTASEDGTAKIWDSDGVGEPTTLVSRDGALTAAWWSPDGERIVTLSEKGNACIWTTRIPVAPIFLQSNEGKFVSARWSPSGSRLLTASDDGTARIWDTTNGEVVHVLRSPKIEQLLTFSILGQELAILYSDVPVSSARRGVGTARASGGRLWIGRGREPATGGDVDGPWIGEWSADGRRLATSLGRGGCFVWSADDSEAMPQMIPVAGKVRCLAWSPTGDRLAVGANVSDDFYNTSGSLAIYSAESQSLLWSRDIGAHVMSIAWDSSGKIVRWRNETDIRAWSLEPTESISDRTLKHSTQFSSKTHARGALVNATLTQTINWFGVDYTNDSVVAAFDDGTCIIWPSNEDEASVQLRAHQGPVRFAAFSSDGERVVSASTDGTARVWRAYAGSQPKFINSGSILFGSSPWLRNDSIVVVEAANGVLEISEPFSKADPLAAVGPAGVKAWSTSADEARLLVLYENDELRVWKLDWLAKVVELESVMLNVVTAEWSPAGRGGIAVSTMGQLKLWRDSCDLDDVAVLGIDKRIKRVAWHPEGRWIASMSAEGEVSLWDARGVATPRPVGMQAGAERLSWNSDGSFLMCTGEGAASVWALEQSLPQGQVWMRAIEFTPGEHQQLQECEWMSGARHLLIIRDSNGRLLTWEPRSTISTWVEKRPQRSGVLSIGVTEESAALALTLRKPVASVDGWIAAGGMTGAVSAYDLRSNALIEWKPTSLWVGSIYWNRQATRFLTSPNHIFMYTVDWPTLREDLCVPYEMPDRLRRRLSGQTRPFRMTR